eukprot:CAMPEP_0185831282 /NCGR_PEP_ID=MMETSP1353-20130828/1398_1 /TAXON_ID=1077150 /ORGANISM="Erythrolobus australicus, Strain CCMP3124" /LENGTH=102 /DNA_ID=CAMNT_0028529329 /DNA_START=160 /DNA_END=468 /DNA_ORIENTATION=-
MARVSAVRDAVEQHAEEERLSRLTTPEGDALDHLKRHFVIQRAHAASQTGVSEHVIVRVLSASATTTSHAFLTVDANHEAVEPSERTSDITVHPFADDPEGR